MNVKELKIAIENLPDDMEVVMQADEEWSRYCVVGSYDTNFKYASNDKSCGDIFYTKDCGYDCNKYIQTTMTKKEILQLPDCLVLFPYG